MMESSVAFSTLGGLPPARRSLLFGARVARGGAKRLDYLEVMDMNAEDRDQSIEGMARELLGTAEMMLQRGSIDNRGGKPRTFAALSTLVEAIQDEFQDVRAGISPAARGSVDARSGKPRT
jgi:hypothetical protein